MAAALIPFIPLANQVLQAIMNTFSSKKSEDQSNVTNELRASLDDYKKKHDELLKEFAKLTKRLEQKKIRSFEELAEHDKQAKKVFVELAQKTEAASMEGKNNIGLFGLTSTGKSTMLNTLLNLEGDRAAKTGHGETTIEITPYRGPQYTIWDIPGRHDELSYLTMQYVSFFKGLSKRLILIQATVKENSSLLKLLDELDLPYDIVFNKFDTIEEEEQQVQIRSQIRSEVQQLGLKRVNNIYFVTAKDKRLFDWPTMLNYLTT